MKLVSLILVVRLSRTTFPDALDAISSSDRNSSKNGTSTLMKRWGWFWIISLRASFLTGPIWLAALKMRVNAGLSPVANSILGDHLDPAIDDHSKCGHTKGGFRGRRDTDHSAATARFRVLVGLEGVLAVESARREKSSEIQDLVPVCFLQKWSCGPRVATMKARGRPWQSVPRAVAILYGHIFGDHVWPLLG